jgi:hypothetical protein
MSNLQEILKSAEESVQTVEDPELRKIAFREILAHKLGSGDASANRTPRGSVASARQTKRRTSPAARSGGQGAARPEVAGLELSPDERGLVAWGSLSADWKKFCWVLEAARLKHVDGLTNAEISGLIGKVFREDYAPKVVNNIKFQLKKGMVKAAVAKSGEKEYQVWKILAAGIKEVSAQPATPSK